MATCLTVLVVIMLTVGVVQANESEGVAQGGINMQVGAASQATLESAGAPKKTTTTKTTVTTKPAKKTSKPAAAKSKSRAGVLEPVKGSKVTPPAASNMTNTTATTAGAAGTPSEKEIRAAFASFQSKHKRKYKTTAESEKRYAIFRRRMLAVYAANEKAAANAKAKRPGVTPKPIFSATSPFADVDDDKFKRKYLAGKPKMPKRAIKVWTPTSTKKKATVAKKKATVSKKAARFAQVSPAVKVSPSTVRGPTEGEGGYKGKKGGGGATKGSTAAVDHATFASMDAHGPDGETIGLSESDSIWLPAWGAPSSKFPKTIPTQSPFAKYAMTVDLTNRFPAATRYQGECQSCWAVASVEHFQAVLAVAGKHSVMGDSYVKLSVQQIIDCLPGNKPRMTGCAGGSVSDAFDYIIQQGLRHVAYYPRPLLDYANAQCLVLSDQNLGTGRHIIPALVNLPNYLFKAQDAKFVIAPCLTGACSQQAAKEQTLLDFWMKTPAHAHDGPRPVVAYVDASNWLSYESGIFPSDQCSSSGDALTHIVQIVGRGKDPSTNEEFWLIRNSWGTDWGENGTNATHIHTYNKAISTCTGDHSMAGFGSHLRVSAFSFLTSAVLGHIRLPVGKNACGLMSSFIHLQHDMHAAPGGG